MVGAVPRRGLARPQVDREGLPGAVLAVVDERAHRREPVTPLEGGLGALLVRVRGHQRGVDVHDHLPALAVRQVRRPAADAAPTPPPAPRPGRPDRGDRIIDVGGQGREQPRDRRIGGDRPEHRRLRTDRGDIGQAVTTERDRGRDIEQHLARVVHATIPPPRRQTRRQAAIQPRDPDRLPQQQRPRGRHQRLAAGVQNQDGTGLDFTYGVPSARQTLDLRKPKYPKQDRHFRALGAVSSLNRETPRLGPIPFS